MSQSSRESFSKQRNTVQNIRLSEKASTDGKNRREESFTVRNDRGLDTFRHKQLNLSPRRESGFQRPSRSSTKEEGVARKASNGSSVKKDRKDMENHKLSLLSNGSELTKQIKCMVDENNEDRIECIDMSGSRAKEHEEEQGRESEDGKEEKKKETKGKVWQMIYNGCRSKHPSVLKELLDDRSLANKIVESYQKTVDLSPISTMYVPSIEEIEIKGGQTIYTQYGDFCSVTMRLSFNANNSNKTKKLTVSLTGEGMARFVDEQSCEVAITFDGKLKSYLGILRDNGESPPYVEIMRKEGRNLYIQDLAPENEDFSKPAKIRIMMNSQFSLVC